MADEIEAALTSDEWGGEAKTFILGHLGHTLDFYIADEKGRALLLHEWSGDDAQTDYTNDITVESRMLPSLMALANAALPDDDPRKITRRDVVDELDAYHAAVIFARWCEDNGMPNKRIEAKERAARHRQRAAKLAALLPPA